MKTKMCWECKKEYLEGEFIYKASWYIYCLACRVKFDACYPTKQELIDKEYLRVDAYRSHVKFEKEIGYSLPQTDYITAFSDELQTEINRLKENGTIKRMTNVVLSDTGKVVHERFLNWYKNGSNATTEVLKGDMISIKEFYKIVVNNRSAAIYIFALRCLHSAKNG